MPDNDNDDLSSDELRWAALMSRAQAGHEDDYRQLLRELSHVIERYLCSRFGHHHFIEDCVQESLVAIHEARHTYEPNRKFRPWLFAIVRHKAIDTLRRQRSHQRIVDRHAAEQLVHSQGVAPQPMENQVFQGHLIRALSPEHREAITLTKLNGFSNAEAAEQLHITEGALKVRIHRGFVRLRRLVEADGP